MINREVTLVKAAIGLLALALSTSAQSQTLPYHYAADTVDINQGVYVCDSATRATVDQLVQVRDTVARRSQAARMGCPFHIGPVSDDYQAEEYPVQRQVVGVCYKGGRDFCEEQAFAVLVYMQGKPKTVISLWLDEDRD